MLYLSLSLYALIQYHLSEKYSRSRARKEHRNILRDAIPFSPFLPSHSLLHSQFSSRSALVIKAAIFLFFSFHFFRDEARKRSDSKSYRSIRKCVRKESRRYVVNRATRLAFNRSRADVSRHQKSEIIDRRVDEAVAIVSASIHSCQCQSFFFLRVSHI